MATLGLIEYADASPEVRAVYDDIMATRRTDWINNFWKAMAHDRQKFDARHAGHLQIRDDEVGNGTAKLDERIKPVCRSRNFVSFLREDHRHHFPHAWLIIHKEDCRFRYILHVPDLAN